MSAPKSSITKTLLSLGLTSNESALYLAGLELASCTPQSLATLTHIKRPTVYHALDTLKEKGLVTEHKEGGKTHFIMAHPENVRQLVDLKRAELDSQTTELDTIIPFLANLRGDSEKTEVVHQYGLAGAKLVMDAAFRSKSKHWDIIAPYHNFLRDEKEFSEQYLRTRKIRDITARTLWELKKADRPLTEEEYEMRNPRILPKALQGKFESMIIIFDDKIAIFTSHKNLSAILITSKETQALFQAMFNGLWELSEPY
jgi:sugar-specific transcriptional regulator TrmB